MVMNKTEFKKLQVKEVLEMLENDFNAQIEDNGDGGRLSIDINGFQTRKLTNAVVYVGNVIAFLELVNFFEGERLLGLFETFL